MSFVSGPGVPKSTSQGLAFLALLAFVTSFFVARLFTTVNPDVVVVSSGIHFHHFWYGLFMVSAAGWLGIASARPEHDRVYALVFGLGLGLIGDETGLLLTLGDYQSELTYVVFVFGVALAIMGIIVVRYWRNIKEEVILLGRGERAVHFGMAAAALSSLAFAFGQLTLGAVVLAGGAIITAAGVWLHRTRKMGP